MEWTRTMQNSIERKQGVEARDNNTNTAKDITEKHWFILYYAGIRLHKLLVLLKKCLINEEIWHPTYTTRKYNNRKKIYETRYVPFYPNYLFIYTSLKFISSNKISEETERIRFLKSHKKYYYLNDCEIEIIKNLENELLTNQNIIEDKCIFKEDDIVKLISGPFNNCNGKIVKISKNKVIVLIAIFGRETKFETEIKGIIKI
jgi:transcription antitermination factor NusG